MKPKNTTHPPTATPAFIIPRGKATIHSDEEIAAQTESAALAELLDEAAADFAQNAPRSFARLLDT